MILDLNKVSGDIKTTNKVVIPPLETIQVQGLTRVNCHSKRVHGLTEVPTKGYSEEHMTTASYSEFNPGSSRVSVYIKNLTGKTVTLPSHTTVGTVTAVDILPLMLAPKTLVTEEGNLDDTPLKEKSQSTEKPLATQQQMNELLTKLDLPGLDTWDSSLQEETKSLIRGYAHIFSMGDRDLGKTSVIKHIIKVTDPIPFKDRYMKIPPSMFEEVREHLKEMLQIGTIRKSKVLYRFEKTKY